MALVSMFGLVLSSGGPAAAISTQSVADAAPASYRFVDVPDGAPFSTEIAWLADQGVSTGWSDGTFRPFQPVTRDAMAAFMYRLAGSPAFDAPAVSAFVDVPVTYQFYTEIAWLAASGISTGWETSNGKEFRPWNLITRDAMAAFLYRFADRPEYQPTGTSPFTDVTTSSSFYSEIRWLAAQGISTGYYTSHGCRAYQPFGNVSRDAMAAFMYRATVGGTPPVAEGTCDPPPAGPVVPNSLEQKNALQEARSYLEFMAFSRQGLIDQMSSAYGSGYPLGVATWAVDAVGADWYAEAVKSAQSYLDLMAFSRQALFDQLTSAYGGQFTADQANHALAAVGY